jgi:hypothetical protein
MDFADEFKLRTPKWGDFLDYLSVSYTVTTRIFIRRR